jgi:DNA recombination-dependent growth factor C
VPALRGSLTYARYFVEGELPDDFRTRFMKSIRLRAMKPLEPDDEELERSGWAKIGEPHEIELGHEDVFYNEYVNLAFRTDRWVIPGPVLKTRVKEAETAYLQKKGREKLSRSEKKELKEMVAKKLRRSMSPATRAVDVSWSLNEGVVRFFSHAQKPGAAMMELFEKTFSLKLIPESPYTLAARLGLSREQEKAWNDIEMVMLATERPRIDEAAAE